MRRRSSRIRAIPCLCGSDHYRVIYRGRPQFWQRSWPGLTWPFVILECMSCKLKRTYPKPATAAQVASGEAEDYRIRLVDEDDANERASRLAAESALAILMSSGPPGRRLLDIGCARGYLVAAANASGWDAYGIDADPYEVDYAKNRLGLNTVKLGMDVRQEFTETKFDVVVLKHVIEHIDRPDLLLAEAASLLASNGILYVEVPNFDSLVATILRSYSRWPWVYLVPEEHVWQFGPKTLEDTIMRAGIPGIDVRIFTDRNMGFVNKTAFGKVLFQGFAIAAWFGSGDRMIAIMRMPG